MYALLAQHNDALQVERYDGYSYGYALLAKHYFIYVLGKRSEPQARSAAP